jgi:hypothetical protein
MQREESPMTREARIGVTPLPSQEQTAGTRSQETRMERTFLWSPKDTARQHLEFELLVFRTVREVSVILSWPAHGPFVIAVLGISYRNCSCAVGRHRGNVSPHWWCGARNL